MTTLPFTRGDHVELLWNTGELEDGWISEGIMEGCFTVQVNRVFDFPPKIPEHLNPTKTEPRKVNEPLWICFKEQQIDGDWWTRPERTAGRQKARIRVIDRASESIHPQLPAAVPMEY